MRFKALQVAKIVICVAQGDVCSVCAKSAQSSLLHERGLTNEDLLAEEVLVLVKEFVWGSELLDGVLVGALDHDSNAVHGVTIVLVPGAETHVQCRDENIAINMAQSGAQTSLGAAAGLESSQMVSQTSGLAGRLPHLSSVPGNSFSFEGLYFEGRSRANPSPL